MQNKNKPWLPLMTKKQLEIFNDYHRFLLCHGPRVCGKSLGILHKCVRHAFDNDQACVVIIGKTLKNVGNGAWRDLTRSVIPAWIKANIGVRWITPPTMLSDSKMRYCVISNRYGGESEFQCASLEHEADVDDKFRDTRASCFYLVECDKHRFRSVFEVLSLQLRSLTVPDNQQCMLLDCNPPELGTRHWLHDVFFKKIGFTDEDKNASDQIHNIPMTLEDNPLAPPGLVDSLKSIYRHDRVKFARLVMGQWIEDSEEGLFKEVFRTAVHVVGEESHPDKSQWTQLMPNEYCRELFIGWDLGDIHHAAVIFSKRNVGNLTAFDVIDELVVLEKKVSIIDFTDAMLEKMDLWEAFLKDEYGTEKVAWKNWSDNSAFRYRSAVDSREELLIRNYSEGRILLHAAYKQKGSVGDRISLVKKLLFEDRLVISAKCHAVQDMLRGLKSGVAKMTTDASNTIERGSVYKHTFDALTYGLVEEASSDVERRMQPIARKSERKELISL